MRAYLVGGPGDGLFVDVPDGQLSVKLLLLTREDQTWVQVDETGPRGHVQGEVVGVGTYARTEWEQDGLPVYRYRLQDQAQRVRPQLLDEGLK